MTAPTVAVFTRETWKFVAGYEGRYSVSSSGRVRSLINRKFLRGKLVKGYRIVTLYNGSPGRTSGRQFKVHRLVLNAFVGPCPVGSECLHGDGVRNNNRLHNLRWGTRLENAVDARKHGSLATGERNGQAKLTDLQVAEIRRRRAAGETGTSLALEFNVSQGSISMLCSGQRRAA